MKRRQKQQNFHHQKAGVRVEGVRATRCEAIKAHRRKFLDFVLTLKNTAARRGSEEKSRNSRQQTTCDEFLRAEALLAFLLCTLQQSNEANNEGFGLGRIGSGQVAKFVSLVCSDEEEDY